MSRRLPLVAACTPALLMLAMRAGAAEPTAADRQNAAALFNEGSALFKKGLYEEACKKFAESHEVDSVAGGTLMNLALCYETIGRFASAFEAFQDALSAALRDKRKDREETSRAHIADLEPKLSRIVIEVPQGARIPELVVARDGKPVPETVWGVAVAVDPGDHTIEASARGRKSWSASVKVGAVTDAQTIRVPMLEAIPAGVVEPPIKKPPPWNPQPALPDATPSGPSLVPGLVIGGAGIVVIGIGAYFGTSAISKRHDVEHMCPDLHACTSEGKQLNDDALRSATYSTIAIGVGLAATAVGVYFLVRSSSSPTAVRVGPRAAPGFAGIGAAASW